MLKSASQPVSRIVTSGLYAVIFALVGCGDDATGPTTNPCLDRADFGVAAQSDYILPYPVGEAYTISQSYCARLDSHSNSLAYDFDMPMGTDIIVARAGVVRSLREDVPDTGDASDAGTHNHVFVQHEDGTVAFYAHLRQSSVLVQVGDTVDAGQVIAASGNSGDTDDTPLTHFGVFRAWPPSDGNDLPVNFRNAEGPLDSRGGLQAGIAYRALPY
jgi:murein DD-endopeptidase MepM/ murein hydrolase activator NlpD